MEDKAASANRRRALRVLAMVGELHKRGYQRLRIAPGMSPSGLHWRCNVAPASNIQVRHGALLADWDGLVAHYSSADDNKYFGWQDARTAPARKLASLFVERFPKIALEATGEDWLYAGWYVQMLGVAEKGNVPIAYADWELPDDGLLPTVGAGAAVDQVMLPMPPPGLAIEEPG
jgi:hypothetical protein